MCRNPIRKALVAALLAFGILQLPAAAQEAPPEDLEGDLVEELIVVGSRPGPAMWKVADDDTVVWLMGVPSALPKGVEWNRGELKSKLSRANVLIMGTGRLKANIFSLLWMFLTGRDEFQGDAPLRETLPPDMLERFDRAKGRSDLDRRYPNIKPSMAAMALSLNFQRSLDMQSREPERSIRREAFLRVRVQEVGENDVVDFLKILRDMPRETGLACMEDALLQAEAGEERAREAARGWARGDLRVAVSAERGWERCIAKDRKIAAIVEANTAAVTGAILKALERPGHAVAIVELRPLLAERGVLMRLKDAPGVSITAPNAPGIDEDGLEEVAKDPEA